MARLFFKDIPAGPTCSACGTSLHGVRRVYDDEKGLYFCDVDCFVDWFVNVEAENYARELAEERLSDEGT